MKFSISNSFIQAADQLNQSRSQFDDRKFDSNKRIDAMDETAVWADMTSETTVESKGARTVCLKTTGHEKLKVSVCLAAKADGSK